MGIILVSSACGDDSPKPAVVDTDLAECLGCLLEGQIESAQPGDTINISAGTYTLSGGELIIDKDLTLVGEGLDVTVIQAASSLELASHRVIRITEGNVVSISGVTIRYGKEASTARRMVPFHSSAIGMISSGIEAIFAEFGGGVYNQGTLTLADSIVTENFAGGGGGIFNGAKITIKNSSISGNSSGGYGGGIFNGGILHATEIAVVDNVAGSGAGISNWGDAFVTASSIEGNRAKATGGGIHNTSVGVLHMESTTVSHNDSVVGGGINNYGRMQVLNSTISDNTANSSAGIDSRGNLTLANSTINGNVAIDGGGLVVRPIVSNEGTAISNTILAGNTAKQGPDCIGVVTSLGNNLVGIATGCEFDADERDRFGTRAQPIDPKLERLKMNGGPTATHALLPGSPAIDAADGRYCPPADQRGVPRPGGSSCDIGSYER